LTAAQALVDWYGSEYEAESFERATVPGRKILSGILRLSASHLERGVEPQPLTEHFQCSESLAAKIAPVLEVLATPVPEFVARARQSLREDEGKRVVRAFALFSGAMCDHVYEPFWKQHSALAPEGWPL
jgi:hypothetical protein